jgi:hypothetical protein
VPLDTPLPTWYAGKEADDLIARSVLQLRGEVAARLLRGERVALPMQLRCWQDPALASAPSPTNRPGCATQAQCTHAGRLNSAFALTPAKTPSMVLSCSVPAARAPCRLLGQPAAQTWHVTSSSSIPAGGQALQLHSSRTGASPSQGKLRDSGPDAELLLELMLLDAEPFLWGVGPAAAGVTTSSTGRAGGGMFANTICRGPKECTLLVLVSAATKMPLVAAADGQLRPPAAFVAAKTARDAMCRLPAQAVTRVAPRGRSATWSQLLAVRWWSRWRCGHLRGSCMAARALCLNSNRACSPWV